MGLLSIFKRQAGAGAANAPHSGAANAADSSDAVLLARTRARHRLIGAAVLLLVGIIGFPIVFETQPRPVAVNVPIEVPAKEGAPALAMPAPRAAAPTAASATPTPSATTPAAPSAARPAAPAETVATEASGDAEGDATPPASGAKPAAPVSTARPAPEPAAKPAPTPKPAAAAKTPAAPKPAPEPKAAPENDAARAKALLDGEPAAAPAAKAADAVGRFVVQVGAFADNAAAREVRMKAQKHGITTYAQVAETAAGRRYRVRIGPFASRDEADKALAKARAAGLSAVVLTL